MLRILDKIFLFFDVYPYKNFSLIRRIRRGGGHQGYVAKYKYFTYQQIPQQTPAPPTPEKKLMQVYSNAYAQR